MTAHDVIPATRSDSIWLTPAQAAKYLGVAVSTLAKWRVAGSGPPFHRPRPRMVRYSRIEIDEWLGARHRSTSWATQQTVT